MAAVGGVQRVERSGASQLRRKRNVRGRRRWFPPTADLGASETAAAYYYDDILRAWLVKRITCFRFRKSPWLETRLMKRRTLLLCGRQTWRGYGRFSPFPFRYISVMQNISVGGMQISTHPCLRCASD